MSSPTGRPRTAVLSAATAAVALIGGWTWAAALQPGGFDPRAESISALAASATAHRWVMVTTVVITGLGHLVTAWALGPARTAGRVLLAAAGVATVGVAAVPMPSRVEPSLPHTLVAATSFVLLAIWPWFAARPRGPSVLAPSVGRGHRERLDADERGGEDHRAGSALGRRKQPRVRAEVCRRVRPDRVASRRSGKP